MADVIYKAGADSYSSKSNDMKKMVGTWQVRGLSRKGFKTHDSDRLMTFYYYAFQSSLAGYDYVVLSSNRTNSGRPEAVIITTKCINKGKEICLAGYKPSPRKAYDHPAKLCEADCRMPPPQAPKSYDQLPDVPVAAPVKELSENQREDEVLALIDCLTGKGNKAKAFRAIARYLIQESINIEQNNKESEDE